MAPLGSFFGRSSGPAPLPYPETSPQGLAARWVRWVAAHGPLKNPIRDETGEHAGHHQPPDVWFLGGTYGGAVERRCAVPAGRPLFFPAFNMWAWPAGPDDLPVVDGADGYASLDGVPVPVTVIGTPVPFEVRGALGNGVTSRGGAMPVSVWGLWARLDPPSPGSHEVAFGGTDGGGFRVEARYRIVVG
ncbi:hypothetical protein [Micromonospora sp. WMMD812]|uniref:hypothetical protein n=1 Tax=Micromonospora sp. WMMD812 TaxID=3015152 RepID=UPI00248C867D|nr:hypothetical protein [Micromonospora sp. WMMD812]WBB70437.1 hypothetical protein O7603_14240 [Micromonospora sp. WMMD812]